MLGLLPPHLTGKGTLNPYTNHSVPTNSQTMHGERERVCGTAPPPPSVVQQKAEQ